MVVPIKAVLGTESFVLPDISFYWLNVGIWQFKHHCMTNITNEYRKNRGKKHIS